MEVGGEMDMKKSESSRSVGSSPKKSQLGSKSKELSNKDSFLRADKIDFKSWDVQLDKHLSRVWSRDREASNNNSGKKEILWYLFGCIKSLLTTKKSVTSVNYHDQIQ